MEIDQPINWLLSLTKLRKFNNFVYGPKKIVKFYDFVKSKHQLTDWQNSVHALWVYEGIIGVNLLMLSRAQPSARSNFK